MLFNYQSHSLKPGIYKIINTHSNRIYIGQAKEFKSRWKGHSSSLKSNKHQNKFLQNDFNKCFEELGNDDFIEFHIIEVMENSNKEERNKREEETIQEYFDKQDKCYNFKQKINDSERTCYSNTPEETKEKLSKASKQRWKNMPQKKKEEILKKLSNSRTEEVYEKISKTHKKIGISDEHREKLNQTIPKGEEHHLFGQKNNWGNHTQDAKEKIAKARINKKLKPETIEKLSGENHWTKKTGGHSIETKNKMSKSRKNKKPIMAINLDNNEKIIFDSICDASKKFNICKSSISKVLKNELNKIKNYTFQFLNNEDQYNINNKHKNEIYISKTINFAFISPDGENFKGNNLKKFCLEKNLSYQPMLFLHSKRTFLHKGWRKYDENYSKEYNPYKKKKYNKIILLSPNNIQIEIIDIKKFNRENNFRKNIIYKLISKEIKSYKGYKLIKVELKT